eukprot:g13574.t1
MKVGVISDTHDRLPTFRQALAMFQRLGVGAILHAGDMVAPFAAKLLNDPELVGDTPVFCIYGNNDGERAGLKQVLPQIVDGPLRLELPTAAGQSRIVVMHHFVDWLKPADLIGADVVITGHNHEASVETKDMPTNLSGKQTSSTSEAYQEDSPMHRIIAIALLLVSFGLPASADNQPNVLFIAIDDLRPELGCYGSPVAVTPNLDKLASEGLLFKRAYCNFAVCGASRASMLSGMYPLHRKRFTSYKTFLQRDAPGAKTLPQVFKEAGYTTISNGKIFHHPSDTEKRSWSEPAWKPKGGKERGINAQLPETNAKLSERGRGYIVEKADVPDNAYGDGKLAEKVIADLGRLKEAGKPFFLTCGFIKPHLPFYAPAKYWDLYDEDKLALAENRYRPKNAPDDLTGSTEWASYYLGEMEPNSDIWHQTMKHGYLACTSYIDKLVGDVLAELDKQGLADNTIVVVWGDHGFHLGEHNFWSKHNTMDHSTRVPLIIRLPGSMQPKASAGVKTNAMVESVDIFPTLCALAGLSVPDTVQGKAFTPLFESPDADHRSSIYTRRGSGDTVITDQFAYTRYLDRHGKVTGEMLYDHSIDPGENNNVADAAGYVPNVRHLSELLTKRMEEAAEGFEE